MADHPLSHILLLSPYRTRGCISGIIWFKEELQQGANNHKHISEYEKSTSRNKLTNK